MTVTRRRQSWLLIFFTCQQRLDSPEVDSLLGKPGNLFAKHQVFLAVNAGPVSAEARNLKEAQALPIAQGLLMNAQFCSHFFDRQDHEELSEEVDNAALSLVITAL